jgi:dihydropteroate synthase
MPRKLYSWKLKDREIRLGERTLIVAILNITPDSFTDGGRYEDPDRAYARALELEELGADILDIGAESTKPGSTRISAAEELRRLIPVLKRLRGALRIPISVDTYKAEVATLAIEHGAEIINDPSGFTFDPLLAKVVVDNDAGLILNHMRGTPETWDKLPPMPDSMGAVMKDLDASANRARRAGVDRSRIVLDPGLGFGKRKEQNAELIARLPELAKLEYPILSGPSRKGFLMQSGEQETLFATAAAVAASVLGGAHLVRVHDVKEMRAAVQVAEEIARAVPVVEEDAAPVRARPAVRKPMASSPDAESEKPPSMRPPLRKPTPPPASEERPAAKPYERREPPAERSFERRPPRRDDGPRDGSRPPRKFGPPSDSRDRPFTPRRSDGPPRRDDGPRDSSRPPRKFGPPSDSRDRPFTPRRSDGPPRRSEGPPQRRSDGPPRRSDGPPREGGRPPRKFGPPSNSGSKDRPYPPRRPGGPGGGFKRPPSKGGPPRRPRPDSR